MAAKLVMSLRNTLHSTTFLSDEPAASRTADKLLSAWALPNRISDNSSRLRKGSTNSAVSHAAIDQLLGDWAHTNLAGAVDHALTDNGLLEEWQWRRRFVRPDCLPHRISTDSGRASLRWTLGCTLGWID